MYTADSGIIDEHLWVRVWDLVKLVRFFEENPEHGMFLFDSYWGRVLYALEVAEGKS